MLDHPSTHPEAAMGEAVDALHAAAIVLRAAAADLDTAAGALPRIASDTGLTSSATDLVGKAVDKVITKIATTGLSAPTAAAARLDLALHQGGQCGQAAPATGHSGETTGHGGAAIASAPARPMQPAGPPITEIPNRACLAYRVGLVLNTTRVYDISPDATPEKTRHAQAVHAIARARQFGATITADELHEIRQGRALAADPRELGLIAQALGLPGWVLSRVVPLDKRVVLVELADGWHATLITDDGTTKVSKAVEDEIVSFLIQMRRPQQEIPALR